MKEGRIRSLLPWGAELLVFGGLAAWALGGTFGHGVGVGVDLAGSLWFQQWLSYCIEGGFQAGHTPWFFFPEGLELFTQTGFNFLDALLAVPFLKIFGMPAHQAPVTVVLLVGNALAMRVLLTAQGFSRPAAWAGAAVFAFHPFVVFELNEGRPTQAMLWFLPLALKELLAVRDDPRWRRAIAGGVLLALQGWTYWFTVHFFVIVFVPLLLLHARGAGREWWIRMAAAAGVALALAAPAMVPMLWLWSQGSVEGLDRGFTGFGLDDPKALGISWWLSVQPAKSLVLSVVVLLIAPRRALWLPAAAIGFVLSIGATLWVPGTGGLPNPLWHGAELALPAFSRLLFPYRAWGALAVLVALALADSMDRFIPFEKLRWGAVPVLAWLGMAVGNPQGGMFISTLIPKPAYVDAVRAAPGVVLDLPFLCAEEAIVYQPLHQQALAGGMTENVPALRPPGLVGRLRQDPLIAAIGDASLGLDVSTRTLQRRSDWISPADPSGIPIRWVVLHTELLRRSDQVVTCWQGDPQAQRDQVARQSLEALLGQPDVVDREAVAWDLGVQR